jgi:4-amino-4-deoxy-L-arabinose transferase-like glycosyltransferase
LLFRNHPLAGGYWAARSHGTFPGSVTSDNTAADLMRRALAQFFARLSVQTIDIVLCGIAILIGLRFTLAVFLPLSFDEAYYWLWSKHLSSGYFEHPAGIAFAIRAGTFLFGDTEFGVRFVPLLASVIASWAVWRSAAVILSDQTAGAIACLFFNLTLMVAVEGMGATPDSLLIAAAAILLWTIAELERAQDGRWWLAIGMAAGAAVAAKYTGFFLFGSLALWLVGGARNRRSGAGKAWLRTIWPYIGAAVALAMFTPTLYWNAVHGFISFRFQAGRAVAGHPDVRGLLEYLGSQIGLSSPGVMALAVMASYGIARSDKTKRSLYFVCIVLWLPLIYFALHSLHDRVQGNWPCFAYPALAIMAAKGFTEIPAAFKLSRTALLVRTVTIPVAAIFLAVSYGQAFFGIIPIGRSDPIARVTGVGFRSVAEEIAAYAGKARARAIVTTNYPVTAWLRFYERSRTPIVQIADDSRFLSSPRATKGVLAGDLLYVTQHPRRELPVVLARFSIAIFSGVVIRSRNGHPVDEFDIFTVKGFHGAPLGRLP